MAILSRPKISPQQRLDLEDFNALLSAIRTDAKLYTQQIVSSENLIISGFSVSGTGLKDATIAMANATFVIPQNTTDFSWFTSAPGEADIVIPDADLTDNTRNYIELELCTEDGTPLTKAFWDPEANSGDGAEFNQIVNTITDLKVQPFISTGGFSGSPDRLPLAIIDTDAGGNIKIILDRRVLMNRLAKPNDIDNQYTWGTKEEPVYTTVLTGVTGTFVAGEEVTINTETALVVTGGTTNITFNVPTGINFSTGDTITGTTSGATGTVDSITESFAGVDKSISTYKEMFDALMTEVLQVKGTRFWWQQANNSLNGITDIMNTVMVQAVADGSFSWDGSNFSITETNNGSPANTDIIGYIRIMGQGRDLELTRQDAASASIPVADGEVLFVKVPLTGDRTYTDAGSGDTNYQTVDIASFDPADGNYWIAYREGARLYVRGYGEMEAGETTPISDPAKEDILNQIAQNQSKNNQDRTLKLIEGGTWKNNALSVVPTIVDQHTGVSDTNNSADGGGSRTGIRIINNPGYTFDRVKLLLRKLNGSTTGNMTIEIYDDNSGDPGVLLATSSTTVDVSTLPEEPAAHQEISFEFASSVTFTATETYHIVLATGGMTGGTVRIAAITGNPDGDVASINSFDGGTSWSANTGVDPIFTLEQDSLSGGLSLSQDAYIQVPGLSQNRNTVASQTITLPNVNSVAYVEINREVGPTVLLPVTVADDDAVILTDNTVVIARRTTTGILVGSPPAFELRPGEQLTLDGALSEINRYFGQLRIKENAPQDDRVVITGVDVTKLDSTVLGQTLSNLLLQFSGAQIDFTTGQIFTEDGVTPLGLDFTPATVAASQYQWYSVTLLPSTLAANNKITGNLLVLAADATGATADSAPRAPFSDGGIPLGQVVVQRNAGDTGFENITSENIVQIGIGAGSGGSGSGNANSFLDLLTDVLSDSVFEALTPYIAETDQDDTNYVDASSTGSYSIVDKRFKLENIGDDLVSAPLLDPTFLADDAVLEQSKVIIKTTDPAPVVELSRNGGAEYQPVTMSQVDESDVWEGTLNFAQEATQNTLTGDGAITGANLEMNATTQIAHSHPFTLAAKTLARKLFGNVQDIVGSLEGTLSARIVADDGGSPSTDINDILVESAPVPLSSVVAGEIEFEITPIILAPGDYHIVYVTDDAYKAVYDDGVIEFSLGANDAGTGAQEFDGTTWSTVAGDFALTHRLEGYELDLRVRIESSVADVLLEGFGVYYDRTLESVVYKTVLDNLTKVTFNAVADNTNEFTLPFLANADLLTVTLLGSGQTFRYGDFALAGSKVIFPENQFNNGGVEKVQTLVFDQIRGGAFDNSDVNAALLASNHLGSSDGSIDKSLPGRGIILQRPDGIKREITIDNFDNIVIYSVD